MRRAVMLAGLLLVNCGQDEALGAITPRDASGLYGISDDGSTVTVPGGLLMSAQPSSPPFLLEMFSRFCFHHEGTGLERADLHFARASAIEPWRFVRVQWYVGGCP